MAWAQTQAPLVLPPVDVPLSGAPPPPESPVQRDPTGLVTVVDAAARSTEVTSVGALVGEAPGITVQQSGGLGQSESLTLRGAASTGVLVLLDGIPLNGIGGIADLSLVPLASVDRAEVLRGGAGARYGAGALGGVVNLVSRTSTVPTATADLTAGSFGTVYGSTSAAGPALGGSGLVEVHAGHSDGDFTYTYDPLAGTPASHPQTLTRENNQATWAGGLARAGWGVGGWQLGTLAQVTWLSRGLAGPVDSPSPDAHQDVYRLLTGARLSRGFASGADTTVRLDLRGDWSSLRGGFFGTGQDDRWWQATLSWDGSLPLGTHRLSASASVGLSLADAATAQPRWAVTSASVQDEWRLAAGKVAIVPSLRLDQGGPFVGLSPKLGLLWLLPAGFGLQANVGQSFRIPSFLELYIPSGTQLANPDLRPETATFVDGGASLSGSAGRLRVAGFAAQYRDLIVYEYQPPLASRPYNLGTSNAWGLEVEGRVQPAPWIEASGSYALLFTEDIRDIPAFYGKEVPYRPRHRGTARLAVGPEWLRMHATVRGQSSMWVNRTNTIALDGRVMLDAGVDLTVLRRPTVVLSLWGTNLTGVEARDLDAYPLPGRALYATLTVRFGDGPTPPPPSSVSHEALP
jgi:iron complex outermembrane receptor protein